jgi:hypothetical protein
VNSIVIVHHIAHYSLYRHSRIVESWIAIRYLGRILECPTFWTDPSHNNHRFVTEKVVKRVTQLVEDLDVEHPSVTNDISSMTLRADIQGVDSIASALLEGAKNWDGKVQFRPGGLGSQLERLVGLLRQ